MSDAYRRLMLAAINDDRDDMSAAAQQIGFFEDHIEPEQKDIVIDLFQQACEPLTYDGVSDFGNSDLAMRLKNAGLEMSMEKDYWHTPPADALFLHRKLGGLYLLAAKLKARIPVQSLFLEAVRDA